MKVNGFIVSWRTSHARFTNPNSSNIKVPFRGTTHCSIVKEKNTELGQPDDIVLTSGSATNHIMDQFDKNVGRKMALRNALDKGGFDKEIRKQFWDAYNNLTATPRWQTKTNDVIAA